MKYKNTQKHNGKKRLGTLLACLIPATCFLLPEILIPQGHCARLYPLNDLKAICAEVSQAGLTRITVKEDRIRNVFGMTGEYVLETDEEQGQIFIRPSGIGSLNPISLTLITEKGLTQDLLLTPTDKAPEALIFEAQEFLEKQNTPSSFPSRQDIEELITACQQNRIPVGYKLMPLDLRSLNDSSFNDPPLNNQPLNGPPLNGSGYRYLRGEIRNDHLKGLTYEVKNNTQEALHLSEEEFAQDPHTIAVLLTKRTLNPGERTHVYVVQKTHP